MQVANSDQGRSRLLRKMVRLEPEASLLLLLAMAVVALVGFHFGAVSLYLGVPAWLVLFRRLMAREFYLPKSPLALAAPVAGVVLDARRARDLWLERDAWKVSIKPSWTMVGSIYSPIEGKCQRQWSHRKGGRSSFVFHVCTDEGDDVVVEFSSTFPIRHRLHMDYQAGDRMGQGQRVGYIFFGGTIDLYAPISSQCMVQPGQMVNAAAPVLELVHGDHVNIVSAQAAAENR
ncbi:MAG: phosphatidylserine decarboxylase [Candidatus Porifericomitaceae bacterium WSBS_2022_MAG_OTU9]